MEENRTILSLEERTLLQLSQISSGIFHSTFLIKCNNPYGFKTLNCMEEQIVRLRKEEIPLKSVNVHIGINAYKIIEFYEKQIEYLMTTPKIENSQFTLIFNLLNHNSKKLLDIYVGINQTLEEAYKIIGREDISKQYRKKYINITNPALVLKEGKK